MVLADTSSGLTGSEIGRLLQHVSIDDEEPTATKWKRLFFALCIVAGDADGQSGLGECAESVR